MKNVLSPPPRMAVGILALGLVACANRGMHGSSGGSGGGSGSTGGAGGAIVDSGRDMAMDPGGAGTGGSGGSGSGGSSGCVVADAGADAGTCPARFNFESCALYGATLNTGSQTGFKSFINANNPALAFCGRGSLQIAVDFSDADGGVGHGELFLPTGNININGKTVTVHVMANPATSNTTTSFYIIPVAPSGGYHPQLLKVSPVPLTWKTQTFTFDAADSGITTIDRLSLQVNSSDGYVGTLWVDEIDITTPSVDAGTGG